MTNVLQADELSTHQDARITVEEAAALLGIPLPIFRLIALKTNLPVVGDEEVCYLASDVVKLRRRPLVACILARHSGE